MTESKPSDTVPPMQQPTKTPQQFFEELRAESTRPHSNEREKNWLQRILVLAQEAGLYTPEPK